MNGSLKTCLSCDDLHVSFYEENSIAKAVRGVSFSLPEKTTLGIVGESGCGKSVTALSIMRLVQSPPGKIENGKIYFRGKDLLSIGREEIRRIRGRDISMIFQDPMTSLNPVYTAGFQVEEALRLHLNLPARDAKNRTKELFSKVGISETEKTSSSYPHQLSGGLRQRVMIAMALSCSPALLIADEPTTALDVTVQATILDLLLELQETMNMSMILISHDLGVVCNTSHKILVMYAGVAVEYADSDEIFHNPLHPYSKELLKTIPSLKIRQNRLHMIEGEVPNPVSLPPGCPFHPRCPYKMEICEKEMPVIKDSGKDHSVRCFLYDR